MFTGIQILGPRIFDYIPRATFSHSVTDVYPQAMANGERIAAHVASGKWYELSTMQRYLDISLMLLKERRQNVFAGKGSRVAAGAEISDSILWDNVVVERGARISRAIIGDDVTIGEGEVITNAAVVRAALVEGKTPPMKALKGEFKGSNFVVSFSQ
jgi:NDP-sugar pyrophosphorylase family protein